MPEIWLGKRDRAASDKHSRAMREFFSYVLESFQDASGWSRDNGYSDLNETANELLNFHTPRGLRMSLASLATPHFATAYNLGTIGVVDGSISYLYSSVPLTNVVAQSASIPLPTLLRSYRQLHNGDSNHTNNDGLPSPVLSAALFPRVTANSPSTTASTSTPPPSTTSTLADAFLVPAADRLARVVHGARALVDTPTLLYGRLYLPRSMLEAYMVKRLAPSAQLQLRAVSDARLPNGGTLLGIVQVDRARYGLEGLASSDGGLLGVRGLYNFGPANAATGANEHHHLPGGGRLSAGAELYYGTLNKSGGLSLGARFATLPGQRGTPLTATLTLNPLMGNISATYAVVARDDCSLATQFAFNVYSYESEWAVGMELWSTRRLAGLVAVDEATAGGAKASPSSSALSTIDTNGAVDDAPNPRERSFQAKLEWRLDNDTAGGTATTPTPVNRSGARGAPADNPYQGVLKARLDQNLKIGLLWEGRIKSLLFSLGSAVDLHRLDQPFRTLGLEIQFSS
ncbi:mitochondrial protein [Niveomyces insectorum RCEF 264]|uniref:Mitochondrial distribution and morphology protein 10 n=1 Tax=Niveomyces insectorum RCEF 264 TaxID=1081102 RepID=A0A162J4E4_9HYPO|nr:mitochondrial protein [Niveomyces insectorum RCEF 264]